MNAPFLTPQAVPAPPADPGAKPYFGLVWAVLTLLLGLSVTVVAWNHSLRTERAAAQFQFDFAANAIVNEITDRLDAHVQALWGATGLLAANPTVTREQWRAFVEALKLPERLPGTHAIAFARLVPARDREAYVTDIRAQGLPDFRIWPEGERTEYVVVTFSEPRNEPGGGIFGFDLLSSPDRSATLERARDHAAPAVSPKLALLREPQTDPQPGFLLFVPVYRNGAPTATVDERRDAVVGYVYTPFRARDFIVNPTLALQVDHAGAAVEVYDGVAAREADLLYRSPMFPGGGVVAEAPPYVTTIAEVVGGRTWTFRIASLRPFMPDAERQAPYLILALGFLASVLAGAVVGTLAVNRAQAMRANRKLRADMARREQVEEQLRQSETKFRQLFDSIPLPTFAIDRERLGYIEVNDAAVAKYAYSHREFASMHIDDLLPPGDGPQVLSDRNSIRDLDRHAGECRHRLRDGTVIDVEVTSRNIELDGRQATILVVHDITERKQAQAALAEKELQLRQAQKLEAIGQLTGGIAHDFNNILTVITGTIEILADGVAHDRNLAAIARLIDEAAARGADLTRDLLAFARRQPLQPRDVDVNALVAGASKLFRSTLGEQVEIESRLGADLWSAFVDPNQLTAALLNLALNARDAMPGGGKLVLETANVEIDEAYARLNGDIEPGPYVLVAVSDTGAGIPEDIHDKVFEPFFTTKEVGKGTGLGLSMVYGFVKQSDGHVRIDSEVGCGTAVKLYLPRATAAPAPALAAPHALAEGGTETILLVEDDELVRNSVTAQLRGLGYTTHVAANAAQALALVERGVDFDLLLTDIVMPGPLNGRALAAQVQARRPGTPVLYTSGYTEGASTQGGRIERGIGLLNKPYRKAELAQRVRELLDASLQPA